MAVFGPGSPGAVGFRRGSYALPASSTVNRCSVAFLYERAGRLIARCGGFRLGQLQHDRGAEVARARAQRRLRRLAMGDTVTLTENDSNSGKVTMQILKEWGSMAANDSVE